MFRIDGVSGRGLPLYHVRISLPTPNVKALVFFAMLWIPTPVKRNTAAPQNSARVKALSPFAMCAMPMTMRNAAAVDSIARVSESSRRRVAGEEDVEGDGSKGLPPPGVGDVLVVMDVGRGLTVTVVAAAKSETANVVVGADAADVEREVSVG